VAQQAEVLEDDPDPAAQQGNLGTLHVGDLLAVHEDRAGGGIVLAVDQLHQAGLAGSGVAHQEEELALADHQINILQSPNPVGVDQAEVVHLDDRVVGFQQQIASELRGPGALGQGIAETETRAPGSPGLYHAVEKGVKTGFLRLPPESAAPPP